jgi:hypothetical protein
MADLKISALPASTTPLAGTEVLPIVQSSSTKKVATDDLTVKNVRSNATTGILQVAGPATAATRIMTVPDANFTAARTDAAQSFTGDQTLGTGNLIQGTAAKGFNFTANTPAAGMTSQLLNWYEEGTWTPVLKFGGATTGITYTTQTGTYTRIGRMVCARATIVLSSNGSASGGALVEGLPFNAAVTTTASIYQDGISYTGSLNVAVEGTVNRFTIQQVSEAGANSNLDRTSFSNTASFSLAVCYQV